MQFQSYEVVAGTQECRRSACMSISCSVFIQAAAFRHISELGIGGESSHGVSIGIVCYGVHDACKYNVAFSDKLTVLTCNAHLQILFAMQ